MCCYIFANKGEKTNIILINGNTWLSVEIY